MSDDTTEPADKDDQETISEEDLEAVTGGAGTNSFGNPLLGGTGLGEAG